MIDYQELSSELQPLMTEGVFFHRVIDLGENFEVFDFTKGYDSTRVLTSEYGVGRYDEHRPGMYVGEQFQDAQRDVHVGIDLAAPAGELVHAFYAGVIFKLGDNALPCDYGPTIITRHEWLGQVVYALHGHLSRDSLSQWSEGDAFEAGDILARLGNRQENGGWNSHLHFQLSLLMPETHDLPGVVSEGERPGALRAFPDPRLVLGALY